MSDGGAQLKIISLGSDFAGGSIDSYEAGNFGTTKNIWNDETKSSAITTISADTRGVASFYGDGDYWLRVKDSKGNVLYDWPFYKITSDTATMWEGNIGTSFPSATSANQWQLFAKHNVTETSAELGINFGSEFIVLDELYTSNLNDTISDIGAEEKTVIIRIPQTLTASLSVPENVSLIVRNGGSIIKDSTYTIDITGDFQAGNYQVFSGFPSGDVTFATSSIGEVRPEWWGIDGTADDIEINLAHDSLTRGTVLLAHGKTYSTTGTITINKDRVSLIGGGQSSTIISFNPASSIPAIHLHDESSAVAPTTTVVQNTIKGFGIDSAGNTTIQKIAIRITDSEETILEDVSVGNFSGSSSIGLQYRGRQTLWMKNCKIFADFPIKLEDNPGTTAAGLDIDHAHFEDTYLGANANPCVYIDSGVNLTNVTFDGAQPWVVGTYGLYWNDTSSSGSSLNLSISGLRTEQGSSATAYSIYISHNIQLQGLNISNSQFDNTRKGVYLRKVLFASFNNTLYGGVLEAFNANSTVDSLSFNNAFWQTGGSATMTGLRQITSWYQKDVANPIPMFALYEPDVDVTAPVGIKINSNSLYTRYESALADNGTFVLEKAPDVGMIDIVCDTGEGGKVVYDHSNLITRLISGTANLSITKDSAGDLNVYYNASTSQLLVQNKTGGAIDVIVSVLSR